MTTTPIPFYVLCGSLGAGKTTLLMRLLEHWKSQGKRAGVLMNEAGEVSIDGPRAGTIAEQVMNLAGGCVCCDTKEDLSWGIAQLVRDYESDVIVLECSGMADPAEVTTYKLDPTPGRHTQYEGNKRLGKIPPAPKDRNDYANRGEHHKGASEYMHIVNSGGMCQFVMMMANTASMPEWFNAVTGWARNPEIVNHPTVAKSVDWQSSMPARGYGFGGGCQFRISVIGV